jgi:menaquinone-specific isochorismate synthase
VSGRSLRARTERLDVDVDLVALAGEDGVLFERPGARGLAGRGAALRIEVPRDPPAAAAKTVHAALDTVSGAGPRLVALGALPFAPDRPGALVVPEVLVGRDDDGARWVTTVLADGAGAADHDRLVESVLSLRDRSEEGTAPAAPPRSYEVRATLAPDAWQAALVAARDGLRAGAGRKVVLAREVRVTADRPLSRAAVARRLRAAYPGCTLFAVDGFVGATPELLVARAGDAVRAQPMAGTAPRSADPSTDARLAAALLSSAKDQVEHRFTIDMVHDTLLPYCSYLDEEAEPSVVAMANVQHLATLVEGRLSAPPASVVELMTALHPTPAVGGSPRDAALALIGAHEGLDRGRYAGPVGWVDADGNGEWAVGIRSAELDGPTARLFAGVGVVADSDPDAELAETRAKLQALLSAVVVV